jgi:hypothetical protein
LTTLGFLFRTDWFMEVPVVKDGGTVPACGFSYSFDFTLQLALLLFEDTIFYFEAVNFLFSLSIFILLIRYVCIMFFLPIGLLGGEYAKLWEFMTIAVNH